MPKLKKELLEFYINAHKNIWTYVYTEISNGSHSSVASLKYDACEYYGYNFRLNCAFCELFYENEYKCSDCELCDMITGFNFFNGCLGGLYDMLNCCNNNARRAIAYIILHCADNWEENAKKGGLI